MNVYVLSTFCLLSTVYEECLVLKTVLLARLVSLQTPESRVEQKNRVHSSAIQC